MAIVRYDAVYLRFLCGLSKGGYSRIARRFKEWMMNGGMGIGRHTYNVMALGDYTSNPQKAAEIIWKMGKKKAAANGAVMRTSVVGLMKGNVPDNAENICKLRSEL